MSRAEEQGFGIAKGAFLGMGRLALILYSMTRVGMEHGWMHGWTLSRRQQEQEQEL